MGRVCWLAGPVWNEPEYDPNLKIKLCLLCEPKQDLFDQRVFFLLFFGFTY